MSSRTFGQKQLQRVDVEWKSLAEVALVFGRGKSQHRPRNDPSLYGGSIPFIQTGDIRNASHIITTYTQTYSEFGLQQSKLWPKGTLCITIAANIAETAILGFDSCFPDSVLGFVANPETTSAEYVEYLLSSIKPKLQSQSTGSAQDNLSMGAFKNIKLPFPPLDEQKRVVSTLRKFEAATHKITEELRREIELCRKQYNYYRDTLLSFEEGKFEWKTLGEVTTRIASGRNKVRSNEGRFPVYGSTGQIGLTNDAAYTGHAILVARVGANCGRVNAVSGEYDVSDNTLVVHPDDTWNIRFAYHQLTHMNLNQHAVGGGQPLVTGSLLKGLRIPHPPMERQVRIAAILDKFDSLTNSITEGLPREIELRQKQYEYYRDLLLSFQKPDGISIEAGSDE